MGLFVSLGFLWLHMAEGRGQWQVPPRTQTFQMGPIIQLTGIYSYLPEIVPGGLDAPISFAF